MVYIVAVEVAIHIRYPGISRWLFVESSVAWVASSGEAIDVIDTSGATALHDPILALLLIIFSVLPWVLLLAQHFSAVISSPAPRALSCCASRFWTCPHAWNRRKAFGSVAVS